MTHCCVELYRPHHVYRSAKRIMDKEFPNFLDRGAICVGTIKYILGDMVKEPWLRICLPKTGKYASKRAYAKSDEFKELRLEMQSLGYQLQGCFTWVSGVDYVTIWGKWGVTIWAHTKHIKFEGGQSRMDSDRLYL